MQALQVRIWEPKTDPRRYPKVREHVTMVTGRVLSPQPRGSPAHGGQQSSDLRPPRTNLSLSKQIYQRTRQCVSCLSYVLSSFSSFVSTK